MSIKSHGCRRFAGLTLIEVMISLALLTIALTGLVSANIVAFQQNAMARRKSNMTEFAQSRLETLASMTRARIPTGGTTSPVDCSAMAAGTFDPSSPPGAGGWMLDVLDYTSLGAQSTPVTAAVGDDLMFGPLLVEGDPGGAGISRSLTLSERAVLAGDWFSGDTRGCGHPMVAADSSVFCREVHVEPYTAVVNGTPVAMLRAWVRVIQGGGNWASSSVTLEQEISQ